MAEIVRCPQCERQLRVPDDLLGKKVKCPSCGATFTASEAERTAESSAAVVPEERIEKEPARPGSAEAAPVAPGDERQEAYEADYDEEPEPRRRRPSRARAREQVSGPATALLVSGIVGCVFAACGLVLNLSGAAFNVFGPGRPGGPGPRAFEIFASGTFAVVSAIISFVVQGIVIFGSQQMKRLESYAWALTSAILTVIPCTTCCLWGLPIGIWSLVVLNKPDVKDAFPT